MKISNTQFLVVLFASWALSACKSTRDFNNEIGATDAAANIPANSVILSPLKTSRHLKLGMPVNKNNVPEILISRKSYVLSWNPKRRNLNWAAWKLQPKDLGDLPRLDSFKLDDALKEKLTGTESKAVSSGEFTNSCFDRGHMVPSGDRTKSEEENEETYLMPNIAPQSAYLNRMIWAHLETRERDLVRNEQKTLYLFTGPIYSEGNAGIGPKKDITVPKYFFKVIAIFDTDTATPEVTKTTPLIVAKMPNITTDGVDISTNTQLGCEDPLYQGMAIPEDPEGVNDWHKYKTTLKEVEEGSGFTFFPKASTEILNVLRSKPSEQ